VKAVTVDALLALAVLTAWLGALGFVRLKTALERLHCATFVNVTALSFVTAATWVQDGASPRSFATTALLVFVLGIGAATSHAIGRALHLREGERR
jgi:multicomponent Na+:H+ antiporter subunit G